MDPSFWVAFFGFLGIALTAVMSRQQHSETMKKADDVATKAVEASEINKELIVDNTNITKSAANLVAIKTEQNTKKVEVIAKAFNGELDERIQTVVREAVAPLIEARSSMDASLRLHSKLDEENMRAVNATLKKLTDTLAERFPDKSPVVASNTKHIEDLEHKEKRHNDKNVEQLQMNLEELKITHEELRELRKQQEKE